MIWSLIKIILFISSVAALSLGAGWLLEAEGGVRLVIAGREYTLAPLQSAIALIVLVLTIWICLKLLSLLHVIWKFLNGDETAMTRYFARNKAARGFDALAQGMMALASGEGTIALAKAEKADRYLNRPDLTNLLKAQAAELAGNKRKAEETYRKLLKNEATRFVGVRGIIKQKLANGDKETALKLAEKAFALKPKHEDTQDLLLKLQAEKEDWAGARQTLNAKLKYGNLPRDIHKRRDAVLALSEAKQIFAKNQKIEAREEAILANRLSPDLIPAAVMAAHSYLEKNQKKHATRLLKKAWTVQPHPDLAAAFAMIEPNETPGERLKRFSFLTKSHKDNPETKMLMAELYIAAEQFPQARRVLGNLVDIDPTTRSITLMAAIERGEGSNDAVVQGWLTKTLTAPRGPQWICEKCQNIHSEWTPTCENCNAFDTLEWKRPSASDVIMPKGSEMLPLLVNKKPDNENLVTAVDNTNIIDAETGNNHQNKQFGE